MVLYGIRLIINIFDLFIYQRYLETFIGKRKTSVEFSVFLLIVCEVIGSAVNQLGINWLNFITMLVVLCIVISQYQAKLVSKAIAILLFMGVVVIFCRLKSGKKIRISSLPKETLYTLTTIPLTTLVKAYNKYRRKHKLLLPEEIKKIREQYDLIYDDSGKNK